MFDASHGAISRKSLLLGGAGLAALTLDGRMAGAAVAAPAQSSSHLEALLAGNKRFAAGTPRCIPATTRRLELANGQAPFAAVLGCADSRVPVETIFDHDPGDIFTVRVAGNFVTPAVLGSLEYAVAVLKSELIMVLGHSACGAVKAATEALKGETFPGAIEGLAKAIEPAAKTSKGRPGDWLTNAIEENVFQNVIALASTARSKILDDARSSGKLQIVGAIYDLHTGKVSITT